MNWETIYTPKHQEGLGLRDMEKKSVVSGAKLWWRWVSHAQEPLEKIWHFKYAEGYNIRELVRFSEDIPSSHIW